jgi:CTP synthase
LCRTDREIPKEERRKLGLFCNVRESAVIEARDVDNIYAVPEAYHAAGLDDEVLAAFGIAPKIPPALQRWNVINERVRDVPYFGICFGMQMAVIEAARNLVGIEEANSTEFGPTREPLVGLMTEWLRGNELEKRSKSGDLGGTMRLGAYPAALKRGSRVSEVYGGATEISERHRHRYEVNTAYKDRLEQHGLRFSGLSPDGVLPEIVEYEDHPWFIGVQFHPELKSRPFEPHPLFASFIQAAVVQSRLV